MRRAREVEHNRRPISVCCEFDKDALHCWRTLFVCGMTVHTVHTLTTNVYTCLLGSFYCNASFSVNCIIKI